MRQALDYPILQAGMPWVSNPELVAAVSNAGGLGILHPSAGMAADGDIADNLRQNMRKVRRLTDNSFGVSFNLANPIVGELVDVALEEGVKIAVTYSGSPVLYTGTLKNNGARVLLQVSTVRHARGPDENTNFVLIPQVAGAVSLPIVASGGIMNVRGYVAALSLGAQGVQMGTRFVATHECIAHARYKEALLGAIDTGTVIGGRYHRPTRLLRSGVAMKLRDSSVPADTDPAKYWEVELGAPQIRAALLEGDLGNL